MTAFSLPLQGDQLFDCRKGYATFRKHPGSFVVWRRLNRGDIVFSTSGEDVFRLYVLRVTAIGVTSNLAQDGGYILYFNECGVIDNIKTSLTNLQAISQPRELDSVTVADLIALDTKSVPVTPERLDSDVLPIAIPQDYSMQAASDPSSVLFLEQCAKSHPFGSAKDAWPLVLKHNDEMVGGALIKLGALSNSYHQVESRLFGPTFNYLKDSSVHIARVLSKYTSIKRHVVFQKAITGILLLSEHLFSKQTSFVSGVSYDLIPAAYRVGARIEMPADPNGTLFYWKGFVPESDPLTAEEYSGIKNRFRDIARKRRQSGASIVFASHRDVSAALKHKMWLLGDGRNQKATWNALRPGDRIFVADLSPRLLAVGTVQRKMKRRVRGYEKYPLAVDFSEILTVDGVSSSDLGHVVRWLRDGRQPGITQIPTDVSLEIRNYFHHKIGRSHMWVTPNPTLLHGTEFTQQSKQIFVVQSWNLRESILPAIRVVCLKHGYTVVHSEDRSGQVIFDPIWRFLNESAVVLVDFTDKRPNVYLEYGMALVLGKPIVAITQSERDVPSDTPNLKWHQYRALAPLPDLERILPGAITGTIADIEALRRSAQRGMM